MRARWGTMGHEQSGTCRTGQSTPTTHHHVHLLTLPLRTGLNRFRTGTKPEHTVLIGSIPVHSLGPELNYVLDSSGGLTGGDWLGLGLGAGVQAKYKQKLTHYEKIAELVLSFHNM
jgi:hypothetical protein